MTARARPCLLVPPRNLHGKEGVNGSSPLEGFTKGQQMAFFVASIFWTPGPEAPKTCPQNLSPKLHVVSEFGLDTRFARHGAPP